MHNRLRKPSAAMIVALVALFVALGGTATATTVGLITSAQIKDGTIQLVDISSKAKAGLHGQQGPQGAPGPSGAAGAAGAAGPTGPAGANGGFDPTKVVVRQGPLVYIGLSIQEELVAKCNAGEVVTGGGFFYDAGIVYQSGPLPDASGWDVLIFNYGNVQGRGMAYAVCARK